MAKHRSKWNSNRYHRLLTEGRGQGTMENYMPWITVHDLASKGVSSRIPGHTTGRIHHTLSSLETMFFYILDHSEKVLDIREQFPLLSVYETLRIAKNAGIRHPRDNASRYPYVMTTDFLITTPEGLTARSIKHSSELSKARVREKLEIERRYWEEKGIEWRIVTENEINRQRAVNLQWIHRAWHYPEMLPEGGDAMQVRTFFKELYLSTNMSVAEVGRRTEEHFDLDMGLGLTTFQYMLLHHEIEADLDKPLDLVSKRPGKREGGAYSWIEMFV